MNRAKRTKIENKGRKTSVNYIVLGVYLAFLLVALQLFRWQVLDYDRFSSLASAQLTAKQDVFTKRGTIYTSDGVILAVDSPTWEIVVSVSNDVDKQEFLDKKDDIFFKLSEIVDANTKELAKEFDPNRITYQVIYKGVTKREKDLLEESHLLGIYAQESVKRLYPNGELFSHVIGYVGTDSYGRPHGNYGIEGFFWGDIKGKEGTSKQERDLSGKALITKDYQNISYREGKNIVLTVNSGIQREVEKILEKGVKKLKGDSGTVIVMNPKTGEVLSMAVYPDYDPNEFWKVKDVSIFRNRAVAGPYEYGSVQKPLTIAMAMDEGKLTEDDICNDTGKLELDEKTIYNYGYAKYGKITPKDTLAHSVNICAANYGLRVGANKMYDYLVKLGIGAQVGVGIHEEDTSYLKTPEKWLKIDEATISYGQAISATPLQVISALSTIANHGERMQPMIVKEIYNNEEKIPIYPVSLGQVFTKTTADSVADMMHYAIMTRRDMWKYRGHYSIAGKSGTAQVAKNDASGYYEDRVNVTYVGFAPAEDARFIMLIKVENPKGGGTASQTVLPLWLEIFDTIKDDLGVPRIK